jgi:VanZ family protein
MVPLVFATLYAVTDEFHQWFVPGRHADVWDVAADAAGALVLQVVLCRFVWRIWD